MVVVWFRRRHYGCSGGVEVCCYMLFRCLLIGMWFFSVVVVGCMCGRFVLGSDDLMGLLFGEMVMRLVFIVCSRFVVVLVCMWNVMLVFVYCFISYLRKVNSCLCSGEIGRAHV